MSNNLCAHCVRHCVLSTSALSDWVFSTVLREWLLLFMFYNCGNGGTMRLADLPKITVLEIWLLQVSKELSLGWGQLWGASMSQRIWLLITGNRRWTFAGQVGCPLTQLSYSRCRYSEWTHTGSHRKSRLTWDMAHPWTIITWKVSEDCCLGKAGVSVPPLTFLAVTHKPIKAQFSTYWPLFHNVLSNSQMSLLTCGLSPFVWTPAPLSEPWYILILMSAPGPAHLDSPRVGLTLSVLISHPLCSYGNGTVVNYPVKKNIKLQPNSSISLPSFIPPRARPRALFMYLTAFSSQRGHLGKDLECEWVTEEMHVLIE